MDGAGQGTAYGIRHAQGFQSVSDLHGDCDLLC